MRKLLSSAIVLFAGAVFATTASATVFTAQEIFAGTTGNLTFTPNAGDLGLKTTGGEEGVGVTGGPSGNEIDVGQSITASSVSGFRLEWTTLLFLFDGPEYGDVEEVARLTATPFGGGEQIVAELQNEYFSDSEDMLKLRINGDLTNTLILSATEANSTSPAEVTLGALFGDTLLSSLTFEAIATTECGAGACDNPSDFSIKSVATVPAPGPLGLLGAGLAVMGISGFRRRVK